MTIPTDPDDIREYPDGSYSKSLPWDALLDIASRDVAANERWAAENDTNERSDDDRNIS